ncbi:hypothetical protein [Deinococcus sp. Leaf326]|uniref:hypothetical protein n=1 Tax=Deinococcus sp. Leaf326 TaxID=1736338 RepID=UPI0006F6E923|nr:hypothetical protein [Deinococcus sp. Leaf326]KQR40668.1 hypothetical protein ASF71_00400 [Deinococcus sp. Leaf326]
MASSNLQLLSVRRRRLRPYVDLGPFFLFFGISGVDRGKDARVQKRFDLEYYPHIVTVLVSPAPAPGRYALRGLPVEANKRGWTAQSGGALQGELSDDGLAELRAWLGAGGGEVRAEALAPAGA